MSGVKMVEDERFRDNNDKLDLDKIKRYEDSSHKVLLLIEYIEEQQITISKLEEENERLQKDVENLQEVVAELGATLLMNGFEIEINGENLSELMTDE